MSDKHTPITKGGCFCGNVRYEIVGALRGVVNCHCKQCIKLNGHFGAHSKAPRSNINITHDKDLAWFKISEESSRGFCRNCGSGLFWANAKQDALGIIAGSLESPVELHTIAHIFVKDKPAFYDITDSLPQYPQSSNGMIEGDYV